jgi:hypothetical protein
MRYPRAHSKHVLPFRVLACSSWSPADQDGDGTKSLWQAVLLCIEWGREKPPFADWAPRPVGQCAASSQDWQQFGCRERRSAEAIGS